MAMIVAMSRFRVKNDLERDVRQAFFRVGGGGVNCSAPIVFSSATHRSFSVRQAVAVAAILDGSSGHTGDNSVS